MPVKLANCVAKKRRITGTFQKRAKVVDSLPGCTSGIAGCRHNLAPRAKRSMRPSFHRERLGSFRVRLSAIFLRSACRLQDHLAWSTRLSIQVPIVVAQQLKRRSRWQGAVRSEEHTSELQSPCNLVCRLL